LREGTKGNTSHRGALPPSNSGKKKKIMLEGGSEWDASIRAAPSLKLWKKNKKSYDFSKVYV
jgi:hypothetical protein